MESERFGLLVTAVLAGLALFVAGTSDLAGNITRDAGSYSTPAAGFIFLLLFVAAVSLAIRNLAAGE